MSKTVVVLEDAKDITGRPVSVEESERPKEGVDDDEELGAVGSSEGVAKDGATAVDHCWYDGAVADEVLQDGWCEVAWSGGSKLGEEATDNIVEAQAWI